MKKLFCVVVMLMYVLIGFSEEPNCLTKIDGYKIVKDTTYKFMSNQKQACFFAFYTKNPEPMVGSRGNGNSGPSIWYGYYYKNNPENIYLFPKPSDPYWSSVCSIDAISFIDMNGDGVRDVTVIGSCDQNAINYTIPFVFLSRGNQYILDEDTYINLYGSISLTIADVLKYIRSSSRAVRMKS